MKTEAIIFYLLISIIFISCQNDVSTGELNSNGRLIFFEHGIHKYSLKNNYGMMIFYSKDSYFNKIRFEFYNQKNRSILKTTNRKKILLEVNKIPKAETLDLYDTCTSSRHRGFGKYDQTFFIDLENICKRNKIKLILPWSKNDNNVLCTCMSNGP